jgi:hypothetical protein
MLRHFSVEPQLTQNYTGRYVKGWNLGHGINPPLLVSDNKVLNTQALNGFIHFQGASDGAEGTANVTAVFRMIGPDGNVVFENLKIQIWDTKAPPESHLQLGLNNLVIPFNRESIPGEYLIEAQVCDDVKTQCIDLKHSILLYQGKKTGQAPQFNAI